MSTDNDHVCQHNVLISVFIRQGHHTLVFYEMGRRGAVNLRGAFPIVLLTSFPVFSLFFCPNTGAEMNLFGVKTTTLIANSEVYTTMRENATFLLELCSSSSSSSSSSTVLGGSQKRSPQQQQQTQQSMPVVVEHQHLGMSDLNLSSKPSTSRADSARNSRIGRLSGKFTPFRKSFVGVAPATPDNVWPAPESFACLECLGTGLHEDLPYEMFGLGGNANENGYDRVSWINL